MWSVAKHRPVVTIRPSVQRSALHMDTGSRASIFINASGGGTEYLHHSPASSKMRRKGNQVSARAYNWATLFLENMNTGTWPSSLGESQMRVKYGRESCGT
jgi:hypothetical protein